MAKLVKQLLGLLMILGCLVNSTVMAQEKNLSEVKFKITRVGSQDWGGAFLIFVDDPNKNISGCNVNGWKNALMVPRNLPNFNEMVSLATAAMLAGKEILVWTGTAYWNKPCGNGFGEYAGGTDGIARISRLDVIN